MNDFPPCGEDDDLLAEGDEASEDPAVAGAVPVLERFLDENRQVFYLRQLQVIFERRFYHWMRRTLSAAG